jgi:hypothetical protein
MRSVSVAGTIQGMRAFELVQAACEHKIKSICCNVNELIYIKFTQKCEETLWSNLRRTVLGDCTTVAMGGVHTARQPHGNFGVSGERKVIEE